MVNQLHGIVAEPITEYQKIRTKIDLSPSDQFLGIAQKAAVSTGLSFGGAQGLQLEERGLLLALPS